ncbi:hypothetical protein J2Z60_000143 [Lactobacillus colini]|uniref:Uncharacterized protein n=1 Tax=Lactobacillus colini TaxID=1819254 RepID=A0ABS4MBE8_9LACO|nr:hypothetical protein [Lactobacillus colini]MBP2056981.1 hypothetical protein [Lactobacillus colini]
MKFLQFVTAAALNNRKLALSIVKTEAIESNKSLDTVLHEYAQ